ncbi:hypothetical protein IR083_19940 [Dysgonomonas sp. GY75]|uniref:hypothetical protein n=1 Tax=Dysgonomonas sp. GY75 TaxID=2780419 RepID=UPI0018832D08|nr:hypothetical protein [Dysgonomonas sp. GY75]MBF0651092.1 hypothetical protein [Dysgonomonas sp. GY75]
MKYIIRLLILSAFFVLSSCSKDEVDFNNNILGVWYPVIEETDEFPVEKVIYTFNADKTGTSLYITYTDTEIYNEKFSVKMDNIYFVSDRELSVTSETYYLNKDGSVDISTDNRSTYSMYIENLSNDSLVFIDSRPIHDEYKKWRYTRFPQK